MTPETKSAYPRYKNAIFLSLLLIAVQAVLSLALRLVSLGAIAMEVGTLVSFGVVINVALERTNKTVQSLLDGRRFTPYLVAAVLITCVGLSIVLSEVNNLVQMLIPMPKAVLDLLSALMSDGNVLRSIVLLAVIAPVTEELFFRRIILDGFFKNYSATDAIVVASVLFGIVHLNPWQALPAFFMGLYLSWVYVRSGSVVLCMIAHGLYNTVGLLIMSITEIPGYTTVRTVRFQPAWFDLLGLLLLAAGILASAQLFGSDSTNRGDPE